MPPKKTTRSSAKSNKQTEDAQPNVKKSGDSESGKRKQSTKDQIPKVSYSYWLMKSEPESRIENGVDVKFGIEDLKALSNQTGCWDGVRNYQETESGQSPKQSCSQSAMRAYLFLMWRGTLVKSDRCFIYCFIVSSTIARNFMRDMKVGQQAFFYHSNCKEPGIAGLMKIVKEAYVDHTQFDKKDPHYDPSSKPDDPKWSMVDVQFERMTKRFIPLSELKKYHLQQKVKGGPLKDLALFTRARLSVQPLTSEEFDFVLSLEDADPL